MGNLSPVSSAVIAVDIGGTHLRAALVAADGAVIGEVRRVRADFSRLDAAATGDAVVAVIVDRLRQAIAPWLDQAARIGIGFPGYISNGVVMGSPNIPALHEVALAERLADALHRPVVVENDANCAALGEWRFGAGEQAVSLLHLTLGTGVGSGLIRRGAIFSGDQGMALEMGHLRVDWRPDARRCGCGGLGCLEQYASATAVARAYGHGVEAAEVHARACDGDGRAKELFAQAGAALGGAIAQAVKLLDLRAVTISGGMIGAWDYLAPALERAMEANLLPPQQGKVTVRASTLHDHAGLLGAAALVM